MIVILDLGSHENTVVARAVRALGVYSEIHPHDITAAELKALEEKEAVSAEELKQKLMKIPQIIDPSVPIGKNDEENVEVECFGEKTSVDFEIPYHTDIMAYFNGID